MNWKEFLAVASILGTIVGTIVGAGIFGLPYIASQSGVITVAAFLVLFGIIMSAVHLIYGEITLRTKERHRLVGYIEKYLGKGAKHGVGLVLVAGMLGSLLIYIILGGQFTDLLLSGAVDITAFQGSLIFFVLGLVLVAAGLKSISFSELFFVVAIFGAIVGLLVKGFYDEAIQVNNLTLTNWSDFKWLLPYGPVLFSLSGIAVIPALEDIVSDINFKKSIVAGTLLPILVYFIFIFSVVGITGDATTTDSLSGLKSALGDGILSIIALFGLISLFSSFVMFADTARKTFRFDYNFSAPVSFLVVMGVPMLMFVLGLTDFIGVLGVVGAIIGGITAISIVLMHKKAKEKGKDEPYYSVNFPKWVYLAITVIFSIGTVLQIIFTV